MASEMVSKATTTIIKGDEVYVFEAGEPIPKWLEDEANQALLEGRARVSFGEEESF